MTYLEIFSLYSYKISTKMLYFEIIKEINGSSNIEMGKKWYENIIFSFIYAIISMKVIY